MPTLTVQIMAVMVVLVQLTGVEELQVFITLLVAQVQEELLVRLPLVAVRMVV